MGNIFGKYWYPNNRTLTGEKYSIQDASQASVKTNEQISEDANRRKSSHEHNFARLNDTGTSVDNIVLSWKVVVLISKLLDDVTSKKYEKAYHQAQDIKHQCGKKYLTFTKQS